MTQNLDSTTQALHAGTIVECGVLYGTNLAHRKLGQSRMKLPSNP